MPRPQFTLRALLVAVSTVAAILGWVAHEARIVQQRKAAIESDDFFFYVDAMQIDEPERQYEGVSWLRRKLGDDAIIVIDYKGPPSQSADRLARAKELFPEATEIFNGRQWHDLPKKERLRRPGACRMISGN